MTNPGIRTFSSLLLLAFAACSASHGPDDPAAVASPLTAPLLAIDDGQLLAIDGDGVRELPGTIPEGMFVSSLVTNRDQSRLVASGPSGSDGASGDAVIVYRDDDWAVRVGDMSWFEASPELEWIWTEGRFFGPESTREVRLVRYEDDGVVFASEAAGDSVHSPRFGPGDAYAVTCIGREARIFFLDGSESRFDPGLGEGCWAVDTRDDAVLLTPGGFGESRWFSLDGEPVGGEDALTGSFYTFDGGRLTWREAGRDVLVAEGLPEAMGYAYASDARFITTYDEGIAIWSTTGEEISRVTPQLRTEPLSELGVVPEEAWMGTVLAIDARHGVFTVDQHGALSEDHFGVALSTFHAYTVTEDGELEVQEIGEYELVVPWMVTHPESPVVAWVEDVDTIVYHDLDRGETQRYATDTHAILAQYGRSVPGHRVD